MDYGGLILNFLWSSQKLPLEDPSSILIIFLSIYGGIIANSVLFIAA